MTPTEIAILSMGINVALALAAAYLAKYTNKFRHLRDLTLLIINAVDDHKVDEKETKDIIDKAKELIEK